MCKSVLCLKSTSRNMLTTPSGLFGLFQMRAVSGYKFVGAKFSIYPASTAFLPRIVRPVFGEVVQKLGETVSMPRSRWGCVVRTYTAMSDQDNMFQTHLFSFRLNLSPQLHNMLLNVEGIHLPFAFVSVPALFHPPLVQFAFEFRLQFLQIRACVGRFVARLLRARGKDDLELILSDRWFEADQGGLDGTSDRRGDDAVNLRLVREAVSKALTLFFSSLGEIWVVELFFIFLGQVMITLGVTNTMKGNRHGGWSKNGVRRSLESKRFTAGRRYVADGI